MYDLDENFVDKYQQFIDTLSKRADNYIAQHYGITPPSEDEVSEDKVSEDNDIEKPICTTKEFKEVCNELGLEEDKL